MSKFILAFCSVLKLNKIIYDNSYNYNRKFLLVCLLIKGKYIIIILESDIDERCFK